MKLQALYNELMDLYAADPDVLGCYVSGSASYGGMTPESDVDFYILTSEYHGFLERIHGVRRVEVRWRTLDEISLDIAAGGPYVYQLMDATPVRDPEGKVAELITDARERFNSFRHTASTVKDIHYRVGEARMKLRSAIRKADQPLQAYLCAVYTELLMEALFVMVDKPLARGTTAWRWFHRLPGLNAEGKDQLKELFQKPLTERAVKMESTLDQLHGSLTAKMKQQKSVTVNPLRK
ncbi:MAG: hypothetical protein EA360_05875 [Balneolaceae bacterium]|nr:MAG: hypothetical protein EA360_05875 [Balneolaceae bacterium]